MGDKFIRLDSCEFCPYLHNMMCTHTGTVLVTDEVIPDWCPLPNTRDFINIDVLMGFLDRKRMESDE